MVPRTLSKRIHGVIRLMIIYGHSGQDIRRAIWRRRYKFISILAVIVIAVMLSGCAVGNRKVSPPLQALDKFWDALGGNNKDLVEEKTE